LNPSTTAIIEKSDNTWNWSKVGEAQYRVNEKTLVVKIPRSVLNATDDKLLDFEFKWSDNMQEEGNIMDFYVNGDVAPSGRFNYHYFTEVTTGLNNVVLPSFVIYPNPVKEVLNITFPLATSGNTQITIYNLSGQVLWQKRYNDSVMSDCINIDFLSARGTYLIRFSNREKSETKKFIVNQ